MKIRYMSVFPAIIVPLSGCTFIAEGDDYVSVKNSDTAEILGTNAEVTHQGTGQSIKSSDMTAGDLLLISEDIASFLADGLNVTASVRNTESGLLANEPFGDVIIFYRDGLLWFDSVKEFNSDFPLSDEAKELLSNLHGQAFDARGKLVVNDSLSLLIDIESMKLIVDVSPSLMSVKKATSDKVLLAESSTNSITDVLSYRMFSNTMHNTSGSSRRDNIEFDNVISLKEHHINTKSYVSHDVDGKQSVELNELTYEYDHAGYRFDAGMKSGWSSLQSLGDVTTLNGQKVYGASFGNVAKSVKSSSHNTLVPVIIYMPGNGEARVFRDGRLLDIQRLDMGNQELDTSGFPVGVYDIEVETSVGGRMMSKRTYQINKPSGSLASNGDEMAWQVWGGAMEVEDLKYHPAFDDDAWGSYSTVKSRAPLLGVSLGSNFRTVNWTATLYQNDDTQVSELNADWNIDSNHSLYAQSIVASDGALGGLIRGDASYYDGMLNLWLTSEKRVAGSKLMSVYDTRLDSAGVGFSLYELFDLSGSLSFSYQQDHENNSRYWSADYTHSFDFGDFGYWALTLGTNKQYSNNEYGDAKVDQYYASMSISLPLDGNLQFGISNDGNASTYNLSGSKNVDLGPITYAGADLSIRQQHQAEATKSYSTYFGYDTSYLNGSVSYSGGENNSSLSVSGRGAIAVGSSGVSAGQTHGDAAIVVEVPENVEDGELLAMVNQRAYELHDGHNLLSVPAYESYEVDIINNVESEKSYQLVINESQFTLYPGNVMPVNLDVKEMVTVFGSLKNSAGDALANVPVKNHIGNTITDSNGNFAIDVDSAYPEIIVEKDSGDKYKVEMHLVSQDGTAFVGDIVFDGSKNELYKIEPVG